MGITVAVTGPTGAIGISTVTALESDPDVDRILGMARRRFDPASHGWTKTEYRRGDIVDRGDVAALVRDADVVVHLAFQIMGGREQTRMVNLAGSRTFSRPLWLRHAPPVWSTRLPSLPMATTVTTQCR